MNDYLQFIIVLDMHSHGVLGMVYNMFMYYMPVNACM